MTKRETIEGIADIIFDDSGILEMRMHRTSIDMDAALKITFAVNNLTKDLVHVNLVDIRKMSFMTSDARKHFGSQDKSTVKAVAIIINSKLHTPIVNLYLKFSRPSLPTKMFDNEDDARSWLNEKLKE